MKTTHELAPAPECGWSSRRVTYTRQMLETLSEIKKQNGGRVSNTVEVYHDLHLHTLGDITIFDLIRFAEDCDKMLVEIDNPSGHTFEVITPTQPA